jgi:hypothetical protein
MLHTRFTVDAFLISKVVFSGPTSLYRRAPPTSQLNHTHQMLIWTPVQSQALPQEKHARLLMEFQSSAEITHE